MCLQVALAALELTNALVVNDVRILEAGCLLGLLPAVLRYAFPNQPLLLRTQAALFTSSLCHGSPATARMFVACQARPLTLSPKPSAALLLSPCVALSKATVLRLARHGFVSS